ncbi:MAG TPA: DUF2232 domain-containing protein [Gemmatimonadaceae bacterium]|nr:DUF2232 domain-containing protein [Gemmatimonadaceae bacterium]
MAEATTKAGKKRSWWPLFWGLVCLLICPYLPLLVSLFPIQQTLLLLVPAVAACSIVGWRLGGRAALALIWIALSVWMLLQPAGESGTQYDQMARGWAVLLAASFGLVSLWSTATPFFSRALASVGIATGIAFLIALAAPSGIARFQHAAGEELTRRTSNMIEVIQTSLDDPQSRATLDKFPGVEEVDERAIDMMREIPQRAATLLPALLALESLAVLALAWGVYWRLTPILIGPPLSPLTEFRFNDQLVWGLAVGATLCLLPAFQEGKNAGYNLLLFFGTLYLIRGTGVLAWIARGRYLLLIVLGLIPQVYIIVTLALGLGDTWLDLRRRAKAG